MTGKGPATPIRTGEVSLGDVLRIVHLVGLSDSDRIETALGMIGVQLHADRPKTSKAPPSFKRAAGVGLSTPRERKRSAG
jgi:hypothetical protein